MSPIRPCSLVFALGCATALSSCEIFNKDEPQAEAYDAANAYNPAAGTAPPAANAYGNPGGYDAGNAYGQPNANPQPYTQPPYTQPPSGAGYAGGYDTGGYGNITPSGTPPPAAGSGRTHKVVRGETLSGISRRYGVGINDVMRANNLSSADFIREGQQLNIP